MNISKLRQSNSQQINADDILGAPVTVTITGAVEGTAEQPVLVSVAEVQGKTYRPSLTMRKVLGAVWGDETDVWIGRRLTLYRNPDIRFGGQVVGGLEISHMSGIDRPVEVSVLEKRGKRKTFTVQPLPDAAPGRDWLSELQLAGSNATAIGQLGQAAQDAGAPANVIAAIRTAFNAAQAGDPE
ncbi:hypothetical protein [Curtobacterium sp. BRD11]|uniref:hypothetical protein n=1 Tax=Curtobacterium sp. BRD11 TaxID=2962581 RepID=UPI002882C002|nr:hypothetical protein [Curtobacterium sp. BRD11]MDT0211212.1 hypothetical protein [Curtobacterium sp. BRD11]